MEPIRHEQQLTLWTEPEVDAQPREPRPAVDAASAATAPRVQGRGLWTIDEVATYLGVPKQTVYTWRQTSYGPKGIRVGKHLRYRSTTVMQWLVDQEQG